MPEAEAEQPQNVVTNEQSDDGNQASLPVPDGVLETASGKWGSEAPAFLQGKNQAETLAAFNTLANTVNQLAQQRAAPQLQQVAQLPALPDPDLAVTDPAAYQQMQDQRTAGMIQQTIAQAAVPVLQQGNEAALGLARMDKANVEVFDKWEHEIHGIVGAVPGNIPRTKALYDQAAKIVRSNHMDELVEAKAKHMAQAMSEQAGSTAPTIYATGGNQTMTSEDDVWSLFDRSTMGKHLIKTLGKQNIVEQCKASDTPLRKYAEMAAASKATPDPTKPWIIHNESLGATSDE